MRPDLEFPWSARTTLRIDGAQTQYPESSESLKKNDNLKYDKELGPIVEKSPVLQWKTGVGGKYPEGQTYTWMEASFC